MTAPQPQQASASWFVEGLDVQGGTIYWLEDVSEFDVELYSWKGGVTKQLTNNGGPQTIAFR